MSCIHTPDTNHISNRMGGKTQVPTTRQRVFTPLLMLLLVATFQPQPTSGYSIYRTFVPNGLLVPDPCNPDSIWQGVGHLNPQGRGARNPFGTDFAIAGHQWTVALCQQDSDGDGLSNGVELGDPDCTWTRGQTPTSTTGLSHPGINNDTPGCDE